jgi:hypothetical protein
MLHLSQSASPYTPISIIFSLPPYTLFSSVFLKGRPTQLILNISFECKISNQCILFCIWFRFLLPIFNASFLLPLTESLFWLAWWFFQSAHYLQKCNLICKYLIFVLLLFAFNFSFLSLKARGCVLFGLKTFKFIETCFMVWYLFYSSEYSAWTWEEQMYQSSLSSVS